MNSGAAATLANITITNATNINKKQKEDENKKIKIISEEENIANLEQKLIKIEATQLTEENINAINEEQYPINNKDNCCLPCIIL